MSYRFVLMTAAALALSTGSAFAAAPQSSAAKPMSAQNQRMADCSKQSAGKKGDERKMFMSSCLKGQGPAAMKSTPQQRMSQCNADAKTRALKGAERKTFMSGCLKGAPAK